MKVWVAFRSAETVVFIHVVSPHDQFHDDIELPVLVSLNWTARGVLPSEMFLVNDAVTDVLVVADWLTKVAFRFPAASFVFELNRYAVFSDNDDKRS